MRATPVSVQELGIARAGSATRPPLHPMLLASIAGVGIVAVAGLAYLYRPQPQISVADRKPVVAAPAVTASVASVGTRAPITAIAAAVAPARASADQPGVQTQQNALAAKPADGNATLVAARAAAKRQLASLLSGHATMPDPELNSSAPTAQQPDTTVAALTPASAPAAAATADADTIVLSTADLQRLADKAAEAIRNGDIAGARLVLERAEQGGDVTAIYALAQTFDPRVLELMHVQGLKGDADKARQLYQQALAAGDTDAKDKLEGL